MNDSFYREAVNTLEALVKSKNGTYSCRDGWTRGGRGNGKQMGGKPQRIYNTHRKVLPCNRVKERRA